MSVWPFRIGSAWAHADSNVFNTSLKPTFASETVKFQRKSVHSPFLFGCRLITSQIFRVFNETPQGDG